MIDFNYNFECDWLIELSDNNLASELVDKKWFYKPITIEVQTVIFIIIPDITKTKFSNCFIIRCFKENNKNA